jgi:hypothetical protein
MNRSILSRLIVRILLLLVGATVLDELVVSRLPGIPREQGQIVLALLMVILAWVYVRPVLGELMRPPAGASGVAQDQSAPNANASAAKKRFPSSIKAIAAVGLSTSVLWIAVASVVDVKLRYGASVTSLLRVGVMITAAIAALAILLIRIAGLSEKGVAAAFSDKALLVVLLIAAIGWWVIPAIVILVSLGHFSTTQYFDVIFPVTYIFLPAAAFVLRRYRGS